jgi:hypothetical protein
VFPLSTMFSSLCSFSNLSSVFFLKLSFLSSCSPLCHYPSLLLQNFATPLSSVLSPVFIGSRGRGSPYPVQVQGMVAWELQGMVVHVWVWVMRDFWASGVERERGRIAGKFFKNLLLPCLCICRGEDAAPCRSKRHRAVFFFIHFF